MQPLAAAAAPGVRPRRRPIAAQVTTTLQHTTGARRRRGRQNRAAERGATVPTTVAATRWPRCMPGAANAGWAAQRTHAVGAVHIASPGRQRTLPAGGVGPGPARPRRGGGVSARQTTAERLRARLAPDGLLQLVGPSRRHRASAATRPRGHAALGCLLSPTS